MTRRLLLPALTLALSLAAAAPAGAYFIHTVTPGESLSAIAATDGLSVAALAAANGLAADAMLHVGQSIAIPPQGVSSSAVTGASSGSSTTAAAPRPSYATGGYLVQPGDSLWAIAARTGTSVAALAAANGLDPNGILLAGSVLHLSGGANAAATSNYISTTRAADTAPLTAGGPYPTPVRLSASDVAQTAAGEGVSGSLADAIGWQESGFNNDLVSPTGAVGVMQIEPGTWDWIQRTLTAGAPLSPYSAHDNVRGGALFLRSLLASTGGDPALAAAAYYQGLASVQQHGLYGETQRYVDSVMALKRRFGG